MEAKLAIPILISCFALLVSVLTLYYSQLRAAAVTIVAGEHVNISYFTVGNVAMTIPISVANNGARTAIVRRVALMIQQAGAIEGYLVEPLFYQRIDEHGNFVHDSQPHPIAVPGRSTETKQVLFRSSYERPSEFRFAKPGAYRLTVLAWVRNSIEPQAAETFSIILSDEEVEKLEQYRTGHESTSLRFQQSDWRKWGAHKLTEVEIQALGIGTA
jgi:hypothetical protein